MRISTRSEGDIYVIGLQGKIMGDPETSEIMDAVKEALFNNRRKVILDLEGLDWMNSSGMGTLIAAQALLREVDCQMKLAGLNDTVRSVLTLNKLNLVFDIHPDVKSAAESYR